MQLEWDACLRNIFLDVCLAASPNQQKQHLLSLIQNSESEKTPRSKRFYKKILVERVEMTWKRVWKPVMKPIMTLSPTWLRCKRVDPQLFSFFIYGLWNLQLQKVRCRRRWFLFSLLQPVSSWFPALCDSTSAAMPSQQICVIYIEIQVWMRIESEESNMKKPIIKPILTLSPTWSRCERVDTQLFSFFIYGLWDLQLQKVCRRRRWFLFSLSHLLIISCPLRLDVGRDAEPANLSNLSWIQVWMNTENEESDMKTCVEHNHQARYDTRKNRCPMVRNAHKLKMKTIGHRFFRERMRKNRCPMVFIFNLCAFRIPYRKGWAFELCTKGGGGWQLSGFLV